MVVAVGAWRPITRAHPFAPIVICQWPVGGGWEEVAFFTSSAVTVRPQVPSSGVGGAGAGTTRAVVVSVDFRPVVVIARTVKTCLPGFRKVVTSQLPSSP